MGDKKEKTINKKAELKKWLWFFCILIIIYVASYALFNYLPFFRDRERFIIVSGSMSPTINRGDIVVVNKVFTSEDLTEGKIIAFYQDLNNDDENEIVVHYIANITTNEFNEITILTKRENVTSYVDWDEWELTQDDVVGIFSFKIPKFGALLMFAESFFGKSVIILDIVIIFLVIDYFKKDTKKAPIKQ